MNRSFARLAMALGAIVLSLQGCRCDRTIKTQTGQIQFVYTVGGVQLSGPDGTYDFGTVSMGKTVTQKVTIQNVGLGTMSVQKFEKVDGPAMVLGTDLVEADPVFTLAYSVVDIASGESHDFELTFAPPIDPTQKSVDYTARLLLHGGNASPDTGTVVITAKAVSGECEITNPVDFGAVAVGDTYTLSQTFNNTRPIDTSANVGAITSSQGDTVFTFTPDSPQGDFTIVAGKSKTVGVVFTPTQSQDYFATVPMRAADGCPEVQVRLQGTGVAKILTWAPDPLDFGYVQPTMSADGDLTFSNQSFQVVHLTGMATWEGSSASNAFKVTAADMGDLTALTIPAATRDATTKMIVPGTAKASLQFKPTVLGAKNGTLKATTDLKSQAQIGAALKGVGGGPDIDVKPAPTLNFGRVPYFAGVNPATFATRNLTISNVGTKPNPPDARANLKLGMAGAGKPYWSVTPKGSASASEICVGAIDSTTGACLDDLPTTGAGAYDPAVGIVAAGASAILQVPVRITPMGIGSKDWDITIYSNDPDEPAVTVTVHADVVVVPPCNYTITPANLNFGVVTPPGTKDLSFSIHNNGTGTDDVCIVSGLDLGAETGLPSSWTAPAVFSLPAGAVSSVDIAPQGTLTVVARAWPQGQLPASPTTVSGSVNFTISSDVSPQGKVNLAATLAPSCLTIAPSTLDFGTVQVGCNSAERTFELYNTCSSNVTIKNFNMVAAAGLPANTGACTTSTACPEFLTVSTGGITAGTVIAPGSTVPKTFSLKYHPIDFGTDTGAFMVSVLQNGQSVDYIVTLKGTGDAAGLNTDTFQQDLKPKADILLVIDNSCSMADKQNSLTTNFGSFIKYATSSNVDFQIGITTTDFDTGENGSLVPNPTTGVKIFKPTTANLEQQFAATANLGTNGSGTESCMWPATEALTAPKITDPVTNLGLLRQDAVLAVVCVTDALDQAPQPAVYYLNQLRNVKGVQRPSAFTYNVVGPFDPNGETATCSYDSLGVGDDGNHALLVNSTNGVKEEICSPDWSKSLENIGKSAFGYRTNFYLTARPDLSGTHVITVSIDGVDQPATQSGRNVWSYDAANNSVNFEPLYVPQPGQTLVITYYVACN